MSKLLGIIFAFILTIMCTACTGSFQASHPHHQKLLMNFADEMDGRQSDMAALSSDRAGISAHPDIIPVTGSGASLNSYGAVHASPADLAGVPENILAGQKKKLGLSREESQALGCDLGDRFDRKALLAYNFSDQQSRLALHMNVEGPSFSDPGHFQLNSFAIRFTHKFQKPAQRQKNLCLFPSGFQGLLGSSYHEFFIRNNYTVMDELKDMGLDLR